MFKGCSNFDKDISAWNTSIVTDMSNMFENCSNFDQDISAWDISNVKLVTNIFLNCNISSQNKPQFNSEHTNQFKKEEKNTECDKLNK
jgi:surface protein